MTESCAVYVIEEILGGLPQHIASVAGPASGHASWFGVVSCSSTQRSKKSFMRLLVMPRIVTACSFSATTVALG